MRKLDGTRPRIKKNREDEILDATFALLIEIGYDRLTLDAVASAAHASKATLYRRWANKASLVVDAMMRAKKAPNVETHDTGSLRDDLMSTYCGQHGMDNSAETAVLGSVVTALNSDPKFAERFREAFIKPKIKVSREIYSRAQKRGEIPQELDIDIITPTLTKILLHRAFVLGQVPDDDTVQQVIDHVILPAVNCPAANPARSDEKKVRTS